VTFGEVGPEGATGQAEVTGTEVPFQHAIIAGADSPPPVPEFCTQEICAKSGTCPSGHTSADAGAAVITAGTATSAVSPNIRAAKAAILRMVHPP